MQFHITTRPCRPRFFMAAKPAFFCGRNRHGFSVGSVMLDSRDNNLSQLLDRIHRADRAAHELFFDAVAQACPKHAISVTSRKMGRVRRLIEAEAWADAALALIELELPAWTLRRLGNDGDEWCCVLTKGWQLPIWFYDSVEAHHAVLPLAIMCAFLEALSDTGLARTVDDSAPHPSSEVAICCDNFT